MTTFLKNNHKNYIKVYIYMAQFTIYGWVYTWLSLLYTVVYDHLLYMSFTIPKNYITVYI